jgi:hypothetical protein
MLAYLFALRDSIARMCQHIFAVGSEYWMATGLLLCGLFWFGMVVITSN